MQKGVSSKDNEFDNRIIAYVSGLGFGFMSGAFSLVNVLSNMTGPGSVGIFDDSQGFYLVSCNSFDYFLNIS